MKKITCPGKKIYALLDYLNVEGMHELNTAMNRKKEDISVNSLRKSFPNFSDKILEGLVKAGRKELIRSQEIYRLLRSYGNSLNIMTETLREHVENCRGEGYCHDKYMLWLERKAREQINESELNEEELPGIINDLDWACLDLFGSERY